MPALISKTDSLLYSYFPGGYFDGEGAVHYMHTDYQGSVVMVTNGAGQLEQHVNYYPYGEPWREPSGQPKLYGSKERDRFQALNDYDFHARRLNSATALWSAPDPLASKYPNYSPYNYCFSNPIVYVDPNGEAPVRAIVTAYKYINKAYSFYKKTGKLTKNNLKDIGLSEIADIAGDLQTIFDGHSSIVDKIGAASDLLIGTDFNNRATKSVDNVIDELKGFVHGNSKSSTKNQHVYVIFNKETNEVVKVGISGGSISKHSNKSYRATSQVNKWNKNEGKNVFDSKVIQEIPAGNGSREGALEVESDVANILKEEEYLKNEKYHKRP